MEGFQALEKEHGPMPLTPTVQTGREPLGKHYYFRYPQGSGITVGTGKAYGLPFDWRGEGGLVVAPPSLHRSGRRYSWLVPMHKTVVDAPAWSMELIQKKQMPKPKQAALAAVPTRATVPASASAPA